MANNPAQDKTVKEAVAELRRGVDLLDALVRRPPPPPAPPPTTFKLAAGLASDKRVFRIVVGGPVDGTTKVELTDGTTQVNLKEIKRETGVLVAEAKLSDLSTGTWETRLRQGGKLQQTTTTEVL
jgi:hypothetical protein